MSLNQILAITESVGINDQRFVGQMLSRNQRISTSEILTVVPFQFTLTPMKYLYYSQNRDLLANLRYYDKSLTQYLNFGTTGWVNYIAYQGDMTPVQIEAAEWSAASAAKQLIMTNLPAIDPAEYLVRAGDFCQAGLYTYIATADVVRGSGVTATIPVHRNIMTAIASFTGAVIGQYGTTVSMGGNTYTGVTFPVILRDYPTYTLMPITNDSFIGWDGNFVAFEAVVS
jgi:hypothetical protein